MSSVEQVDVSVILPVYNEVDHLEQEVKRIQKSLDGSEFSYEIVVVDDGSSDGSGELAQSIEAVRTLRFLTNRGSGSARRYGTLSARGDIVVWTDVDMTYPNDEIPELVRQMAGYDQVVGARKTESGTPIPDLNSGFRPFRREVADQFLYLLPAASPV